MLPDWLSRRRGSGTSRSTLSVALYRGTFDVDEGDAPDR